MTNDKMNLRMVPAKSDKLPDLIERALMEPTLLDALVWISIWDTDRAVRQALREYQSTGGRSSAHETFTGYLFKMVSEAWEKRKHQTFTLQLVAGLRKNYFPDRKKVGDCIDVALVLAEAMRTNYMSVIQLLHGKAGNCAHVWLRVNSVDIDPATDCTTFEDGRDLVHLATGDEYVVAKVEPYDLNNYYKGLTFKELCAALVPSMRS